MEWVAASLAWKLRILDDLADRHDWRGGQTARMRNPDVRRRRGHTTPTAHRTRADHGAHPCIEHPPHFPHTLHTSTWSPLVALAHPSLPHAPTMAPRMPLVAVHPP